MKRITSFFFVFLWVLVPGGAGSAQTLESLHSRVSSIENRISAIEKTLAREEGLTEKKEATPKKTYVIRDGDSIGGIARKFRIPRQALLDANGMSEGQPIYIGETLVIPTEPNHGAAEPDAGVVHVVRAGDTLIGLSRMYGTTVEKIKQANNLRSDLIAKGQKLMIATGEAAAGEKATAPAATTQEKKVASKGQYEYDNPLLRSDETYGYYAVRKGDNLYALARDFFTTMKELQRLNEMGTSTVIHPGDELIVPTSKYNEYHGGAVADSQ